MLRRSLRHLQLSTDTRSTSHKHFRKRRWVGEHSRWWATAAVGVAVVAMVAAVGSSARVLATVEDVTTVTQEYLGSLTDGSYQVPVQANYYTYGSWNIGTYNYKIYPYNNYLIFRFANLPTEVAMSGLRIQGLDADHANERRLDLQLAYRNTTTMEVVDLENTYYANYLLNQGWASEPAYFSLRGGIFTDTVGGLERNFNDNSSGVYYIFANWDGGSWVKYDYNRCLNAASFQKAVAQASTTELAFLSCQREARSDGQGYQFTPYKGSTKLTVTAAEQAAEDARFWEEYHIDYALITIEDEALQDILRILEEELQRQDIELLDIERRIINVENGYSDESLQSLYAERDALEAYQAEYWVHLNYIRDYALYGDSSTGLESALLQAMLQIEWFMEEVEALNQTIMELEAKLAEKAQEILELETTVTNLEELIAALQEKLAASEAALAEQQALVAASEAELAEQRAALEAKEAELVEQQAKVAAQEGEIANLRSQLETLGQEVTAVETYTETTTTTRETVYVEGDSVAGATGTDGDSEGASSDTVSVLESTDAATGDTSATSGAADTTTNSNDDDSTIAVPQLGGLAALPWWFWLGVGAVLVGIGFEIYLHFTRRRRR